MIKKMKMKRIQIIIRLIKIIKIIIKKNKLTKKIIKEQNYKVPVLISNKTIYYFIQEFNNKN